MQQTCRDAYAGRAVVFFFTAAGALGAAIALAVLLARPLPERIERGRPRTLSRRLVSTPGRAALLTFRLYQGSTVVAEISCNGKQLREGESSAMQCLSGDALPATYNKIEVSDLFSGVVTSSPSG